MRRAPASRPPLEALVFFQPSLVESTHAAWVAAGAEVVTTNTFLANELDLEACNLSHRTRELNQEAARLALRAGASFVLGSVGPGLQTMDTVDPDARRRAYLPQLDGLIAGGAHGVMIETCTELAQLDAAISALREVDPQHRVWTGVSLSPSADFQLRDGTPLAESAALLADRVDLLGVNCCAGPDGLAPALTQLARSGLPLALYPNAGLPHGHAAPLEPEPFGAAVARLAHEFDVALAGGCCGASTEHIAALAAHWSRP